ncbi:MAG: glycosyltransferase, partial [Bacteroidota bacterium]|nr:glycosyltransferase [Bacteroidota bacterium]
DSSMDGTLAIANEFVAAYPQVRLVHNTSKKGMVSNWERCVEEARYEWIKFLFQDDLLAPDCVEKMVNLCYETGSSIAFCRRDFLVESDAPQESSRWAELVNKPEKMFARGIVPKSAIAEQVVKFGTENIIGEPTCLLFHKSLLSQIGSFDRRFNQSVDLEFALRAALTCGIAFTPEPLVQFRVHGRSQTTANTSGKKEPALLKRSIRSLWGDDILLLKTYLSNDHFQVVRELWTKEQLTNKIRYLYLRACRNYGVKTIKDALNDVIPFVPEIQNLRYNYLLYKIEKYKYKAFLKQRRDH